VFEQKEQKEVKENNIKDSIYYWLSKSKPFYINGEYALELLWIDKINNSAKIQITNLKTKTVETLEVSDE
jgi:hypothetical protein